MGRAGSGFMGTDRQSARLALPTLLKIIHAMVGSIIGGVLSIGGAVAGGIASSNAAKRAANITRQQQAKNRAWYEYNMNTPYTQRADALASIKKAREIFMERNKNASQTAAVSGATDEAAARQKEDANKVIEDTMTNIAAQGAAHKDQVEESYMNRDAQLAEQQRQTEIAKANAIAGAASQVTKAGASIAAVDADGGLGGTRQGATDVSKPLANPAAGRISEPSAQVNAPSPIGESVTPLKSLVDENGKRIL